MKGALIQFSDVQAWLSLARPDEGLRKSKPGPQAFKSLSRPCWNIDLIASVLRGIASLLASGY